jgi:hypothetical protein
MKRSSQICSMKEGKTPSAWCLVVAISMFLGCQALLADPAPETQVPTVSSVTAPPSAAEQGGLMVWGVTIGLGLSALTITGFVLFFRAARRKAVGGVPAAVSTPLPNHTAAPAPAAAPAPVRSVRAQRAPANGEAKWKTSLFAKSGHARNHRNGGSPEKRVFDYNRYFTDLMSTVSGMGSQVEYCPVSPYEAERMMVAQAPVQRVAANGVGAAAANAELINQQKSLIEDQKRLIEEQTRLIEEKGRLIAEKTELLKMRAELAESSKVLREA